MYATMSIIFLFVNIVCASLGQHGASGGAGDNTWRLVLVRVLVNDLLFILEAVCLATSLLLLTRSSPPTTPYLRSKVHTLQVLKEIVSNPLNLCSEWVPSE